MKRALATALALLLTLLTVRMILRAVSPDVLSSSIQSANWPLVGLALMLFASVQWLRAWRFSLLTTGKGGLPGAHIISVAFRLNLLNFVIPFRAGELGYPILMNREAGQPFAEALGVLLLARIFDLCVVGSFILGFSSWFGVVGDRLRLAGGVAAVLLFLSPLLVIAVARSGLRLRLPSGWMTRTVADLFRVLGSAAGAGTQMTALLLTFLTWATFGIAATFAARSVTGGISISASLYAAAAGNLAFALPVNGIAGLGTSQAAWVLAAKYAGTATEPAVLGALMSYAASLASAVIGGCAGFAAGLGRSFSASENPLGHSDATNN